MKRSHVGSSVRMERAMRVLLVGIDADLGAVAKTSMLKQEQQPRHQSFIRTLRAIPFWSPYGPVSIPFGIPRDGPELL